MTSTPMFVHYPSDPKKQKVFSDSKISFREDMIRISENADKNPLCANKTVEENRRIIAINICNALNKAIEKATDEGKKALKDARDWACQEGYQSLRFSEPVPDKDIIDAAHEIWKAYKKEIQ